MSDSNDDMDIDSSDDIEDEAHFVFRGNLNPPIKSEILTMLNNGLLVKGVNTHGGFVALVYPDQPKIVAAYICSTCQAIYPESSGRNTLRSHQKRNHATDNEQTIELPAYFKDELTRCLAEIISGMVLPYTTAEKEELISTLDFVFQEGFKLGVATASNDIVLSHMPSIREHIPSRWTVSRYIESYVENRQPIFDEYVKSNIEKYGGAASMDFGTKEALYFTSSIHFITKEWNLNHWMLDLHEYEEENSAAPAIKRDFLKNMESHGLNQDVIQSLIYSTDRGGNIILALNDFNRVDDPMHILNTLAKHITSPYKIQFLPPDYLIPEDVKVAVEYVDVLIKKVVKIIHAIHANKQLKQKLKKDGLMLKKPSKIRCLTNYLSAQSYIQAINANKKKLIIDALGDAHNDDLEYLDENYDIIVDYVNILNPVYNSSILLESEIKPTINLVLIRYFKTRSYFLKECCNPNNSEFMKAMAISGYQVLSYLMSRPSTVGDVHLLGLLLDPLNKDQVSTMYDISALDGSNLLRRYVKELYPRMYQDDLYSEAPASPFSVYCNTSVDPIDVEINLYLSQRSAVLASNFNGVLDYWRQKERIYPHIAKAARRILPISGSAPSERIFGLVNREISDYRGSLDTSTVRDLVTMKNLKRFDKYMSISVI